jgi:hypothetical protein
MTTTNAEEMAKAAGVDAKTFRQALRDAKLSWHDHYDRWTVEVGSKEHAEMERVLKEISH